jgi:hypothetical protein
MVEEYKPEIQDEYLSTQETATLLGIDYSTARRWLLAGKLPGDRIANRVFGRKAEIECMANELKGTISIAQAAKRIGKAERTVNHLLLEGGLKGVKWMRRWYVLESSVEEYIAEREAGEK